MIQNKELLKKFSREKTYNAQRYIETTYYLCEKFPKICIICDTSSSFQLDDKINFPQCRNCKSPSTKITRSRKLFWKDPGKEKKKKGQ